MTKNVEGKIVVITGASSGLGEAAARLLTEQGAKVVIGARRADKLTALAQDLGLPAEAAVETDVSKVDQVQKLVDTAVKLYGKIDVIINNAGVMPVGFIEEGQVDNWDNIIDINIKGTLYGIHAALPYFKKQKSGQFINVSSVAGHKVRPGNSVYAASKHAVRALSEGLRQEVKPYNLRTTIVSPGVTDTELITSISDVKTRDLFSSIAVPASTFADVVSFAISQPENVDINEIVFRPTAQEN